MDDVQFWWDGWEPLLRILLLGTLGYATLVALLRLSGQRSLATMTPFDFVITVTLGSAFGRILTATEVSVAEMVVTFGLLVALQWGVAIARGRWETVHRAVDVEPSLLYHEGRFIEGALRRHRLREKDLLLAAREKGLGSLAEAHAVVLESDGKFSVIKPAGRGDGTALEAVAR